MQDYIHFYGPGEQLHKLAFDAAYLEAVLDHIDEHGFGSSWEFSHCIAHNGAKYGIHDHMCEILTELCANPGVLSAIIAVLDDAISLDELAGDCVAEKEYYRGWVDGFSGAGALPLLKAVMAHAETA